ncbi:hypothetical protein [Massilia sp. Root351]|jgi:hypothetical protein|uniref:hypothetical protein n=1 Tax=Massilia sp. Root351 TaxID=1736522 RepID=UPI0012F670F6|nr:hypothetical protein [Massilia sp. Root351]
MNIVFSMRRRPAIQPVAVVTRLQFGDADTPLCLDAQIAPAAPSATAATLVHFPSDLSLSTRASMP